MSWHPEQIYSVSWAHLSGTCYHDTWSEWQHVYQHWETASLWQTTSILKVCKTSNLTALQISGAGGLKRTKTEKEDAAAAWGGTIGSTAAGVCPTPLRCFNLTPECRVTRLTIAGDSQWGQITGSIEQAAWVSICLHQRQIQKENTVVNTRGYQDESHHGLLHDLR